MNVAVSMIGCVSHMWLFCLVFLAAATPKQIRELMKVDGLTNDEVKSHLQVCICDYLSVSIIRFVTMPYIAETGIRI